MNSKNITTFLNIEAKNNNSEYTEPHEFNSVLVDKLTNISSDYNEVLGKNLIASSETIIKNTNSQLNNVNFKDIPNISSNIDDKKHPNQIRNDLNDEVKNQNLTSEFERWWLFENYYIIAFIIYYIFTDKMIERYFCLGLLVVGIIITSILIFYKKFKFYRDFLVFIYFLSIPEAFYNIATFLIFKTKPQGVGIDLNVIYLVLACLFFVIVFLILSAKFEKLDRIKKLGLVIFVWIISFFLIFSCKYYVDALILPAFLFVFVLFNFEVYLQRKKYHVSTSFLSEMVLITASLQILYLNILLLRLNGIHSNVFLGEINSNITSVSTNTTCISSTLI